MRMRENAESIAFYGPSPTLLPDVMQWLILERVLEPSSRCHAADRCPAADVALPSMISLSPAFRSCQLELLGHSADNNSGWGAGGEKIEMAEIQRRLQRTVSPASAQQTSCRISRLLVGSCALGWCWSVRLS